MCCLPRNTNYNVLSHFIEDREYCTKQIILFKTTLSDAHTVPHEITCDCLLWKTKELPLLAIKAGRGLIRPKP